MDYVDLYLIHWPVPSEFESTLQSYSAIERLQEEGTARAIGVSNFSEGHLEKLISRSCIVPAVNQVELHPRFSQRELSKAHARLGIVTQAWSPLGGSIRRLVGHGNQDPLRDPRLASLASDHGKAPAQIILRWHVERGRSPVVKSFTPESIRENFDIWDFALDAEEIALIDKLDKGVRSGPDPDLVDRQTFVRRS
jgi:diketogulonate reductase-like aldo/keto reductase